MIDLLKTALSSYLLIPLVACIGLFYTLRCGFPQLRQIGGGFRVLFKKGTEDTLSSFAAVAAVLGGNLGTGNIAGIAVALSTGGPGALLWMWIMAFLGMVLKYVGCSLAIQYRKRNAHGKHVGGPMYYIQDALNAPFLAKLYALLLLLSALTVGNLVQVNSLALPLQAASIPGEIIGTIISILVALVIFGGLRRFSVIVSKVVPFMALLYVVGCLIILISYRSELPHALSLIWHYAFTPMSALGGAAGWTLMKVIATGFDRGLFATDAGAGLAPIIHASVGKKPTQSLDAFAKEQSIIAMVSPLIVMVICTLTGLVLITTGVWNQGITSTNACVAAFCKGFNHPWAGHLVTITLVLFAYTTILTWSFCADKAVGFVFGRRFINIFRVIFIAFIPLGSFMQTHIVWSLADIVFNIMVIINVGALAFLYKKI